MRKAAELAESAGGFLELDAGESIGVGAVGADAETIEEGASDQMRRVAPHRSDAEIDARLAKKHRPQLHMGLGDVEDARIAEAFEIVDACIIVGCLRANARQGALQGGGARSRPEIAAADGHAGLRA